MVLGRKRTMVRGLAETVGGLIGIAIGLAVVMLIMVVAKISSDFKLYNRAY